ncbi:MAG: hypothetical protein GXO25_01660 [Euryarchaeota archaeon]|nr:hypothetical protein [Euryarchaeota archaeon]
MRKILILLLVTLLLVGGIPGISVAKTAQVREVGVVNAVQKEPIQIDGHFMDWKPQDVKAVDNYSDEYKFNDGFDDSRDIIAFYYHKGYRHLFFRLDFLDLKYGAEIENLNFYIAIDFKAGGQNWLPDYVETETDTPWEVCLAIYDTNHYAVYLSNWSFSNESIDGIAYSSQWDSVELSLNETLLTSLGWNGGELHFQVYTTKDYTNGGAGEIPSSSTGQNTEESDIVDCIGSTLYRGDSSHNGWLNGSISSSTVAPRTRIAFLQHANQFLKNVSYFVGNKEVGMYAVPSIHAYWHVPVNLHISGTLADAIEYYRPDFNRYIRKLVDEKIAYMVGGFYAEYIPKYMPSDFNNWSMAYTKYYIEKYYNYTPDVCWIPERVYWHGWENTVKNGHYKIVVADTEVAFNWYHPSWAKEGKDEYYVWNDSGIKVLFISNTGRAGNWQNVQDMLPNPTDNALNVNIRKLLVRNEITDPTHRYILYMDDWEKFFGNAPGWGGPEVVQVYNESIGWIAQHQWIKAVSLDELANLPVHGDIKINDASYFWLTQNLGTAGSDSTGPTDRYDLYDAWYYDPYHEITVGTSYFNYTPKDNIEKLGDYRTPGTVIYDVWTHLRDIPKTSPIYTVAMKSFAAMMYETAWRGKGISITMHDDISSWEKDQAAHIRDCMMFYYAQKWLENRTTGVWKQDVDLDGVKEGIVATKNIYAVIEPRGGKISFAINNNGTILIGNPTVGWHAQGDAYTDIIGIATTNYHYQENPVPYNQGGKAYAFSDIGFENDNYSITVNNSEIYAYGSHVRKIYRMWNNEIEVQYSTSIDVGVRVTLSPDFASLEHMEYLKDGRVCGFMNTQSNFSVFVIPHNATFYSVKRITLASYLVYYAKGNFSFILRYGNGSYQNMAPWPVKKIPVVRVPEDGRVTRALNLSNYFEDDLDTKLNYTLEYNTSPGVYVILNGTWISVDAETGEKNNNWNGWINVTVIATDSRGKNCTAHFKIYVYPVNDAPVISVNIKNNETIRADTTVNITTYDVDGYTVSVWYSIDNKSFVKGTVIHLKISELGAGKHTLVIKASDGNATVYDNLTFYVVIVKRNLVIPAISSALLFVALMGVVMWKRKKSKNSLI